MDYTALRAELLNDPAALGYAALGDQAAADRLNATDTGRTLNRTNVPTTEVLGAIADAAWPAVASASESKLLAILGMPYVDASNTNIRAILGAIFPTGGSTGATRTALLALATRVVSRQEELRLGVVTAGDVQRARAGSW